MPILILQGNIFMKAIRFLTSLLLASLLLQSNVFAAGSQTAPTATSKKVLLVVRMEGKSLPIDQKIQQHLAARGYIVTLHSQYAPVDAAKDNDLVVLSSTVRSRDLLGAYRHVSTPMLTWESDLLDDLGMSGKHADSDFGRVDKERYIWLVNAPHPLAAGLPAGVVNVYEKAAPMNWGKPGLGATTIATLYGHPKKRSFSATKKAQRWTTNRWHRHAA
jgi:hypothetical protein